MVVAEIVVGRFVEIVVVVVGWLLRLLFVGWLLRLVLVGC